MGELLAGRRYPALDLVPEVAPILNLADANLVLASCLDAALRPINPYQDDGVAAAGRAVSSVIANYPNLVDSLIAAAGTDTNRRAIAADLIVLAVARNNLLKPERLADLGPLLAATPDEFAERIRPADNRYSTSDRFDDQTQMPGHRWMSLDIPHRVRARFASTGFPLRLAVALLVDAALVIALVGVADRLAEDGTNLPGPGLGESLAAAGLLIALHVLAVELASGALPAGLVASVAWPARLVSAYVLASALVVAVFLDLPIENLPFAIGVVLFAHIPLVAKDLVAKSDLRRAVKRVGRDRSGDLTSAGRQAGDAFVNRSQVRLLVAKAKRIRKATTEPVTRRRLGIVAPRNGYVAIDVAGLSRLDDILSRNEDSPLTTGRRPPFLVLLHEPGAEVMVGDALAVVEVDEPKIGEQAAGLARQFVRVASRPSVDRARESIEALSDVFNRQAGSDGHGAQLTSSRMHELLARFLEGGGGTSGTDSGNGYLESLLPFDPELQAVKGFESLWIKAIDNRDETEQEALRQHALRLASLTRGRRHSCFVDFLIVRLDVVAREAPVPGVHSCAALIAELAAVVSDEGRRESYFSARSALETLLDRLVAIDPIPREEELVRQRFEELLARGLIADYFLETQVERGCRKLAALLVAAAPRRKVRIGLGIAKIGVAALSSGRFALAARLAFLLRDAEVDFAEAHAKAADESYRLRMSSLSEMAGGLFGPDIGAGLTRYLYWAETLLVSYPAPATTSQR